MIRLRAWAAIFVAALGLYFVGRWQGAQAVAATVAEQNAETALSPAVKRPYLARQDSLRRVAVQQLLLAQSWRHRADSLRALGVQVDTVVTSDTGRLSLWRAIAAAEHAGTEQCALAVATCQDRAQTAEARAATLDSLLGNLVKVKSCKILWVRCPSRTATGLIGYGLGALTVLVVRP